MAAPLGNQFAKGFGRPPSPTRALRQIALEAARLEAMLSTYAADALYAEALISQLMNEEPDRARAERNAVRTRARLETDIKHLLALVSGLEPIAEALEQAPKKRGKRQPPAVVLHADSYTQTVATCAAWLDRLTSEGTAQ